MGIGDWFESKESREKKLAYVQQLQGQIAKNKVRYGAQLNAIEQEIAQKSKVLGEESVKRNFLLKEEEKQIFSVAALKWKITDKEFDIKLTNDRIKLYEMMKQPEEVKKNRDSIIQLEKEILVLKEELKKLEGK